MRIDKLINDEVLKIGPESALRFPLAGLTGFNPGKLFDVIAFEESDKLILTLGLIYNDFKQTLQFSFILNELRPPQIVSDPPNKHHGQISGTFGWLGRIQVGILEELRVLLKDNEDLIQRRPFEAAVARLKKDELKLWNLLLDLADVRTGNDPWVAALKKFLTKARANGGYHYKYNTPLMRGYIDFYKNPVNPENKLAYMSMGRNLEQTRFYFSDAAMEAQTKSFIEETGLEKTEFDERFLEYINALHVTIRYLIEDYLKVRNIVVTQIEV
jgi:hypothetical protein